MDFTNRAARPAQSNQQIVSPSHGSPHHGGDGNNKGKNGKFSLPFSNLSTALLFVCAAVVVAGLIGLLIFSQGKREKEYVEEKQLQAVFLNGGQVYFGNIASINDKFLDLRNIYYLRVNQQVQPRQDGTEETVQDISLVKLGCELHGPDDQMIINQEQILFWENLKSDGKVTEAVKKYVEANPKGQDCSQEAQQQDAAADSEEEAEPQN